MKNMNRLGLTLATLALVLVLAGCLKTTSVSGNPFTFENHTKIQKGVTTKGDVATLLEGSPITSGGMSDGVGSYQTFEFTESVAPSSMANRIPFMAKSEVSWTQKQVIVYYDENDVVTRVVPSESASGSSTKTKVQTKEEVKEDMKETKDDAKANAKEVKGS